jgi:hypothetical protein
MVFDSFAVGTLLPVLFRRQSAYAVDHVEVVHPPLRVISHSLDKRVPYQL